MHLNFYSINFNKEIFEDILDLLIEDDYNVGIFSDENVFRDKSGNPIDPKRFLEKDFTISFFVNFDFSKEAVEADVNFLIVESFDPLAKLHPLYLDEFFRQTNFLSNCIKVALKDFEDWMSRPDYRERVKSEYKGIIKKTQGIRISNAQDKLNEENKSEQYFQSFFD